MFTFEERIEAKSNVKITLRERGKIVGGHEGKNIWLDLGREYLAQLIGYQSFSPDTPFRDDRIKYMGLGIGGTGQRALALANAPPISPPYTGTNNQTDTDPTVTELERPVQLADNEWVGQIQAPPTQALATEVTFARVFTENEISYDSFLEVPLSEAGLFTAAADPAISNNNPVAYETFATLVKTAAINLEIIWTIRF